MGERARWLTAVRDAVLRVEAIARDELRVVVRSRRGRLAAVAYAAVTLLPLTLYLWLRSRLVVPWPLDAADACRYLGSLRLVDFALVLVLAHDLLSRGDREGWQDGFATLPVGELTWLLGRLAGRLAVVLVVVTAPWLASWGLASAWAGYALDPLPFLSAFIGGPLLSVALLLPLVVVAGAAGNSLVGAAVVFGGGLVVVQMVAVRLGRILGVWDPGLPELLLGGGGEVVERVFACASLLFDRHAESSNVLWMLRFVPDPGRGWPPWGDSAPQLWRFGLVPLLWLLYVAVAPSLLRLRRRCGRWQPQIPGVPTFSRWLSDLVDQTRPTAPESRGARWLSAGAALAVVAAGAWTAVAVADMGGTEREAVARAVAGLEHHPWPTHFVPTRRRLQVRVEERGTLVGRQWLLGRVEGRTDRPLPFALAPGIRVLEVQTGAGAPLQWQRDLENLWIVAPAAGPLELDVRFTGRPRRVRRASTFNLQIDAKGMWHIMRPLVSPPAVSDLRPWSVDLHRLAWAPEPLTGVSGGALAQVWGLTELDLTMPARMTPVPLPGPWHERVVGGRLHAQWQGVSPHLPPVRAGALRRARRPGVVAVAASDGTDLEGLLDLWQAIWQERAPLPGSESLVLSCVDHETGWPFRPWWRSRPRSLEPPLRSAPVAGLVEIGASAEVRPGVAQSGLLDLGAEVRRVRARLRFQNLARRFVGDDSVPARWFVWQVCRSIEQWPSRGYVSLELVGSAEHAFRATDLREDPNRATVSSYRTKLAIVVTALLAVLGGDRVEAGLESLAEGEGAVSLDAVWQTLAGDQASDLEWFRDNVLFGHGVPCPVLEEVEVVEGVSGWRMRVRLANRGDAATVVPVQVLGSADAGLRRVALAAGETVTLDEVFDVSPGQVVVDPEGLVVRRQVNSGLHWTRWGGIQ